MIVSRRLIAMNVQVRVNSVQDHGLLDRGRRQPRCPGMLSTSEGSDTKVAAIFVSSVGRPGEGFQPLELDFVIAGILSIFRLSRVSECLLTSNLAEVKLFLLSSCGGSVARDSMKSRSSASNDLLRIEGGDLLHSESLKREEEGRFERSEVKARRRKKFGNYYDNRYLGS